MVRPAGRNPPTGRLRESEQWRTGLTGEDFLLDAHPDLSRPAERRPWDLEGADGRCIEVKTDTHRWDAFPNFWMERRTIVLASHRFINGGPWRAVTDGATELVYLMPNPEPRAWVFTDLPALVAFLDEGITDKRWGVRRVRTGAVAAQGYLVPRVNLAGLCTEIRYTQEPTLSSPADAGAA